MCKLSIILPVFTEETFPMKVKVFYSWVLWKSSGMKPWKPSRGHCCCHMFCSSLLCAGYLLGGKRHGLFVEGESQKSFIRQAIDKWLDLILVESLVSSPCTLEYILLSNVYILWWSLSGWRYGTLLFWFGIELGGGYSRRKEASLFCLQVLLCFYSTRCGLFWWFVLNSFTKSSRDGSMLMWIRVSIVNLIMA